MNNWFECKVNYDKAGDDGLLTRVSELYLVDALSFTEAEERITEEIEPMLTGEFVVASIKKIKIHELIDSDVDTDDKWWKAKVMLVTINEDKGTEKLVANTIYIKAETINRAIESLDQQMSSSLSDYFVSAINETLVLDVFKYQVSEPITQQ
ncbi:MAG: phage tail protein [Bacteroidales bacterium]|nr:MAG: phage tail protein [Bacteroidales bacterium]